LTCGVNSMSHERTVASNKFGGHQTDFEPKLNSAISLDFWPGIQLYYPPVKYVPTLGTYEDLDAASQRFIKYAHRTSAHTLIFDLEDGCRQKEMSRELLRDKLPSMPRKNWVQVAIRVNSFRTEEYEKDMKLVRDLADHIDIVMLAKAGESYGAAEIRDLSAVLSALDQKISIQPIIEHPISLKIAADIMQYPAVKHVVFGIHDFSKAMGIRITPERWTEELKYFLNQMIFEARIAGKGVIGGVETLIGRAVMPEALVESDDVRRWLELQGDHEARVVFQHACFEASIGLTGKQVIHPSHIHICKVAYTPSPTDIAHKIAMLKAAADADALLGGAIKFENEMVDPPMFAVGIQTLLRAHAFHALNDEDTSFLLMLLQKLPAQVIRENWPYGVIL
jgi:citrate lyase subunit beta/citryl-CoA lyase